MLEARRGLNDAMVSTRATVGPYGTEHEEILLRSPFAAAFFLVCWTISAFSLFSFKRASRLPMTRLVSWVAINLVSPRSRRCGVAGIVKDLGAATHSELSGFLGDTHDFYDMIE